MYSKNYLSCGPSYLHLPWSEQTLRSFLASHSPSTALCSQRAPVNRFSTKCARFGNEHSHEKWLKDGGMNISKEYVDSISDIFLVDNIRQIPEGHPLESTASCKIWDSNFSLKLAESTTERRPLELAVKLRAIWGCNLYWKVTASNRLQHADNSNGYPWEQVITQYIIITEQTYLSHPMWSFPIILIKIKIKYSKLPQGSQKNSFGANTDWISERTDLMFLPSGVKWVRHSPFMLHSSREHWSIRREPVFTSYATRNP